MSDRPKSGRPKPDHPVLHHPVVVETAERRAQDAQLRVADAITKLAGSMTFVMIGQNRQSSFQQAKADHDFVEQVQELRKNTELTEQIHAMAREIHGTVCVVK